MPSTTSNRSPQQDRKYDIIVFGATGNAGTAMVEYFVNSNAHIQWAIAGRSSKKLEALKGQLDAKCGIVIADVKDYQSMLEMARSTKVLLTATGPYVHYGESSVRCCIEARTHYADITGEVSWVEEMRAKYEAEAKAAGVCINSFCGYDCIPPELSVALANDALGSDYRMDSAEVVIGATAGGMPRGTLLTCLTMFNPMEALAVARGSYAYVPTEVKMTYLWAMLLWLLPSWSHTTGGFTLPNFMGTINIPVLYRSAHTQGFGSGLRYYDRVPVPATWYTLYGLLIIVPVYCTAACLLPLVALLLLFPPTGACFRRLAESRSYNGDPRATVTATTTAVGRNTKGEKKRVQVHLLLPGDPGIYATALLACVTATEMLHARDSLPAGFNTPLTSLDAATLKNALVSSGVQCSLR